MRIISPPTATAETVTRNLAAIGVTPLFLQQMLPALWTAAVHYAIDPVGMVAQAFKETGGGKFSGNVTAQFYNTAGIKVRHPGKFPGIDDGDRPLAHAQFASWDVGARAHAQHLRAYAGAPVGDLIVDPRYWLVIGRHSVTDFAGLSGKWAPGRDYGQTLEAIARRFAA